MKRTFSMLAFIVLFQRVCRVIAVCLVICVSYTRLPIPVWNSCHLGLLNGKEFKGLEFLTKPPSSSHLVSHAYETQVHPKSFQNWALTWYVKRLKGENRSNCLNGRVHINKPDHVRLISTLYLITFNYRATWWLAIKYWPKLLGVLCSGKTETGLEQTRKVIGSLLIVRDPFHCNPLSVKKKRATLSVFFFCLPCY